MDIFTNKGSEAIDLSLEHIASSTDYSTAPSSVSHQDDSDSDFTVVKRPSCTYLIAEDNPADVELVKELIDQAFGGEYSVMCVDRFDSIIQALQSGSFEALILDMNLPDRSGVDNISDIGQNFPELPIVVLTGQDDLDVAAESLSKGAQDYLSKNHVSAEVLSRSLRYAIERKQIELRLKKALEETAVQNKQLRKMAQHDFLTALPNRAYFQATAHRMIRRAQRSGRSLALLYFDLDGFKKVNDGYGHDVGDELLCQAAQRLKKTVRGEDFIARLGGDEFVIASDIGNDKQEVYKLVNRLLKMFEEPFFIEGHEILSSLSIGVAFYPDAENLNLLIRQADFAMYEAKANERSPVCFYTEQLESRYANNVAIEAQLAVGLEANEFYVHYQPVVAAKAMQANHAEALIRWQSPQLGNVPPSDFIGVAENSPAINEITRFVISQCAHLLKLVGDREEGFNVAINVCASQLSKASFCDRFLSWLEQEGVPPANICIELTERQMVKNALHCNKQLQQLRDKGIKVALDDFGTGYSSFTHLLELPVDYLKLDRILIDHIDQNHRNQALTAGIIAMAHRLDISVVAEGIERAQELDVLRELGCDYFQGYYLGRPVPIDEFACCHLGA